MEILDMTIGELGGWATLAVFVVLSLVEVAPIKINPWSTLARWIGRSMNGELIAKVDNLEKELIKMQDTEDERNAKAARTRVLRFGDECLHGVQHSKEHFDDILLDISDYEQYCDSHKEFKNGRMQLASQHIKETYKRCMEEHSFL